MIDPKIVCEWFARCSNLAVGVVAHPVLTFVPACQRCADKAQYPIISWNRVEIS